MESSSNMRAKISLSSNFSLPNTIEEAKIESISFKLIRHCAPEHGIAKPKSSLYNKKYGLDKQILRAQNFSQVQLRKVGNIL